MRKKTRILLCLLSGLAVAAALWWSRTEPVSGTFPIPNGYDLLISATKGLTDPLDVSQPTIEQLRMYVAANSNALQQITEALDREFMLPTEFSPNYMNVHIDRMPEAKRAAKALVIQGKLAELEGRYDEAASVYMQAMQLGRNVAHNGLLIDMLVATACEGIGANALDGVVPNLPGELCKKLAAELQAAERTREPLKRIVETEHIYMRSFPGLGAKLDYLRLRFQERFTPNSSAVVLSGLKYGKRINDTKRLAVRLACRAYESETGKKATGFGDLIPTYLEEAPVDSQSGTNLVYNFDE